MIRTKYKDLTEDKKEYIKELKNKLIEITEFLKMSAPSPDLTEEEQKDWETARNIATVKITEASFWIVHMETT